MSSLIKHATKYTYTQTYKKFVSIPREKRQPITEREIRDIIEEWMREYYPEFSAENIIRIMEKEDLLRQGMRPGTWIPQPRMIEE